MSLEELVHDVESRLADLGRRLLQPGPKALLQEELDAARLELNARRAALRLIPPRTRAVFFDAVGTLIHPDPPAPAVYAEAARRFGSRLDLPAVTTRFRAAFRRQEEIDHAGGLRTDEAREVARWRAI